VLALECREALTAVGSTMTELGFPDTLLMPTKSGT
jgi:hypothetical protein